MPGTVPNRDWFEPWWFATGGILNQGLAPNTIDQQLGLFAVSRTELPVLVY